MDRVGSARTGPVAQGNRTALRPDLARRAGVEEAVPLPDVRSPVTRLAVSRLQAAAGNKAACTLLGNRSRPDPHADGTVAPTVQRAEYRFKNAKWKCTVKGTDEYRPPERIRWTPDPVEGQTYDSGTGMYRRPTKRDKARGVIPPERHIFDMMNPRSGWTDSYGRSATAYSRTSGGDAKSFAKNTDQGPHVAALIFKKTAIEAGAVSDIDFDLSKITERSILLPSPGQNRKLMRRYEERNKVTIPKERKVALDRDYKAAFKNIKRARDVELKGPASKRQKTDLVRGGLELAAPTTYSHGKVALDDEIGGKGENTTTATRDITKLMPWRATGGALPTDLTCFDPHSDWHPDIMERTARAWMHVSLGRPEDVSDYSDSSDDEYSV